jgi:hypothetical protein
VRAALRHPAGHCSYADIRLGDRPGVVLSADHYPWRRITRIDVQDVGGGAVQSDNLEITGAADAVRVIVKEAHAV